MKARIGDVDWWREERAARERGFSVISGIDEAGRGPLAGPVVAACVVLPWEIGLPGVCDSKILSAPQRDRAFERIQGAAVSIGVGVVGVELIDCLNILRASHEAMRLAVAQIEPLPDLALIDGLPVNPFPVPQIAVVKGDGRSLSIAAASIVAKVTRDRLMNDLHEQFPEYGFNSHKGYSTPGHLASLAKHGPCALHRRSFAPVQDWKPQPALPFDNPIRDTGDAGEKVANAHLSRLGWTILASRFHCRHGEIDIVAMDGDIIVFVEVKARRGGKNTRAADAVDARKRRRLAATAEAFLVERQLTDAPCRFDVAEVIIGPDGLARVTLISGAFIAGE